MGHYSGRATISDGVNEGVFVVEIHTRPGENAIGVAWHVNIQGQMPHELRFPAAKALSVRLADGRHGVGTLVDPHLIRGAGKSPLA
jgi:hypothetical protein